MKILGMALSAEPRFSLAEYTYRPRVTNPVYKERAIPSEINVAWMTGKKHEEKKQAFLYFNWEKVNEVFKRSGEKNDMQIKITKENVIELMLNGQSFEADSTRVFDWSSSINLMYKNVK